MEKNLVNYNLDIPFKEFMAGQIIDPVQFNDDMAEIEEKVNEIIGKHNSLNNSAREHIANKDNPHEVTAHQVGTYTGEEIDGFVNDIKDGGLNPKSIKNEVLADNCVDSRTIANHTITASKVDSLFGGQIDISNNTDITDRYTKTEVNNLIKEKVGEGAYSKEEIDEKFQEVQAGQIVDKTIGVDKLKDDVGTLLDISANKSITDRYTKEEVDVLVRENGLPRDWGGLEEIVEKQHYGHLPVANVMTADEFIAPSTPVLDIDVREVVGARNGYDNLGKRLNSIDSQLEQNMNKINERFNTNENLIINNFKTVQLVGHRGAMKFAPQNTMSSFEIAQKLGFKAIEVDLQVTSDNEIVIYHDDNLNTLTNGSGTIASKTLSEIKSYVYNQGSNVTKFNNEKIPTLDEFLIFCKGHNIIPFLEIKVTINDLIAQKIVDTVDKFGFKTSAVYFGYNINNLELIRKYSPHSRVLLSLDSYDETRLGWIKTLDGKIGIVPYVKNFTVEQLKTLTNQGLDIYPYDVKSYEEYLKCCNNGCSGMLVDNIGGHNLYESTIL